MIIPNEASVRDTTSRTKWREKQTEQHAQQPDAPPAACSDSDHCHRYWAGGSSPAARPNRAPLPLSRAGLGSRWLAGILVGDLHRLYRRLQTLSRCAGPALSPPSAPVGLGAGLRVRPINSARRPAVTFARIGASDTPVAPATAAAQAPPPPPHLPLALTFFRCPTATWRCTTV